MIHDFLVSRRLQDAICLTYVVYATNRDVVQHLSSRQPKVKGLRYLCGYSFVWIRIVCTYYHIFTYLYLDAEEGIGHRKLMMVVIPGLCSFDPSMD